VRGVTALLVHLLLLGRVCVFVAGPIALTPWYPYGSVQSKAKLLMLCQRLLCSKLVLLPHLRDFSLGATPHPDRKGVILCASRSLCCEQAVLCTTEKPG